MTLLQVFLASILLLIPDMSTSSRNPDEQPNTFEGDLSLKSSQVLQLPDNHVKAAKPVQKWPHHVIPFEWSPELQKDKTKLSVIMGSMEEIQSGTCIRFKPRSLAQTNFVRIQLGSGCSAAVGEVGGRQNLTLRYATNPLVNCLTHGEVLHELMHVIGFWHEQSRPDRDQFVEVKFENMSKRAKKLDFQIHSDMETFQLRYDFSSVLHYSGQAFQKNPAVNTIQTKMPGIPIGLRKHLSHLDKLKVNRMYGCI